MLGVGGHIHGDRQTLDVLHEGGVDAHAIAEEQVGQSEVQRDDRSEAFFL